MRRVGNDEAGFSVGLDGTTRTNLVKVWGFWNREVAAAFEDAVVKACREASHLTILIIDATEFKPQREEGQEAFGRLLTALPKLGITGVHALISSQLTKLQLLRIAREVGAKDLVQFVWGTGAEAVLAEAPVKGRWE